MYNYACLQYCTCIPTSTCTYKQQLKRTMCVLVSLKTWGEWSCGISKSIMYTTLSLLHVYIGISCSKIWKHYSKCAQELKLKQTQECAKINIRIIISGILHIPKFHVRFWTIFYYCFHTLADRKHNIFYRFIFNAGWAFC